MSKVSCYLGEGFSVEFEDGVYTFKQCGIEIAMSREPATMRNLAGFILAYTDSKVREDENDAI